MTQKEKWAQEYLDKAVSESKGLGVKECWLAGFNYALYLAQLDFDSMPLDWRCEFFKEHGGIPADIGSDQARPTDQSSRLGPAEWVVNLMPRPRLLHSQD